ncbi:sterol carrier family protein [Kocuria sp.]|uniref:sterol carrier family protein n=1 Tax=Kocuria sp. TaxID=1871328 RepID=UPI0026DF4471|nr:sterol carrier family protein [Kocuria sp.]MDO5618582.1 sterol carrier family protein [Kocuria sp.]
MGRRRIDPADGTLALAAWRQAMPTSEPEDAAPGTAVMAPVDRKTLATAVRFTLEELGERVPGNSVEVRVPPFGVTQCIPGPRHTRGTPPNVVETDAATWLKLVTGRLTWDQALASGAVNASGTRAELETVLPLFTGS